MASYSRSPSPRKRSPSYRRRSPSPRRESYSRRRSLDRRSDHKRHDSPSPKRYRSSDRRRSPDRYKTTEIDNIQIRPEESYSEFRTRVRIESNKTIWAPSPERARSLTPEDTLRLKKHRDTDNEDTDASSSSSSEEHRRRRHRHKHKKSSSSSKHKKSSRKKNKKKRHYSDDDESDSSKEKVKVNQSHLDTLQDLWVEKKVPLPEDLASVGPVPLVDNNSHNDKVYGDALLPGEGSAMAAYVKEGKRIPRRGEIGLSGDQIADFERAGYVMSGSRHQRMNAVRLRKENQVISAEEKRLVLQHAQEQKIKRENEIISGFREVLNEKFKKE
ncbi:ras-induced vulval development antagonist-domain-containing protein [Gilbertella persicaria]|uniref:ras-induced vulval development antagonist-domain-containing protein n=1 Tax=Gilbertella persicaria TaxID=101096 RepID=UPI00221ED17F|nr:ras-induced vulval development antagonist-domain-containing protein [Gilbertella persicaria]KAI8087847.1 ras-induced vulval development antagonist-domain-containing protein [Gilbertella persicaria]